MVRVFLFQDGTTYHRMMSSAVLLFFVAGGRFGASEASDLQIMALSWLPFFIGRMLLRPIRRRTTQFILARDGVNLIGLSLSAST